ncbi:hypothetical protein PS943_01348 [Pseudomonas fluorescens]|jgi:hypothetical protein|uniref:Uncharacterized protein n=1 Tax=Pseudomonas fluorescens TaxID=294 RepID=A0A5E7W364_PSEFL|nr:hypothetical protein PS943_01348 [Pseudomonas fluorescens]
MTIEPFNTERSELTEQKDIELVVMERNLAALA